MQRTLPTVKDVLNDFSASYWLKNALRSAIDRDPVDALNDAEFLVEILNSRIVKILNSRNATYQLGK